MSIQFYFAYGSNLHPLRLRRRAPSATPVATLAIPGWRLSFSKRGQDGSAKATLVAEAGTATWGALYSLSTADRLLLDRVEGLGKGYREQELELIAQGQSYAAFFYIAAPAHTDETLLPFHWYRELVVAGARYHDFPADYVGLLEAVPVTDDPQLRRRRHHEALLRELAGRCRS